MRRVGIDRPASQPRATDWIGRSLRSPVVRTGLVLSALLAVAPAWRALPLADWVERALEPIRAAGAWGALIYVLAYVAAVVLMVPGSPITLAGGYLYGPTLGMVLVSLASTAGASAAFVVARTFGREWVRRRLEHDRRLAEVDRAVAARGAWVVLLLRLSPIIPFNALNYALGLTGVRFLPYLVATWVGMLPGTLVYVLIGVAAGPRGRPEGLGPWSWAAILTTTLVAVVAIGRLARRAIERAQVPAAPEEAPACRPNPSPSPR